MENTPEGQDPGPMPPDYDKSDLQIHQFALLWFGGQIGPVESDADCQEVMKEFITKLGGHYNDSAILKWGEDKVPFLSCEHRLVIFKKAEVARMEEILKPLHKAREDITAKILEYIAQGQPGYMEVPRLE